MEIIKVGNLLKEDTKSVIKATCSHCDTVVKIDKNDYKTVDYDHQISWECPICLKENIHINPTYLKSEKKGKISDWFNEYIPEIIVVAFMSMLCLVIFFRVYVGFTKDIHSYKYEITYTTSDNLYRFVKAVDYIYYEDDNTLIIEDTNSQHHSYHDVKIKSITDLETEKEITDYHVVSEELS